MADHTTSLIEATDGISPCDMTGSKPMAGTFWTGLPGLDDVILPGGSSLRSLNVIGGAPGTGKTVLALQMLFANATPENRALYFTTVSEPTIKFLGFLQDFEFYDPEKMFQSIVVRDIGEAIQSQPLQQVIETIKQAITEEKARIVVIDSFKAISDVVPQVDQLRVFAYNLAVNLASSMCTAFLVGEYLPADVSTVPIFAVADGILFLSFESEGLTRQRYLEWHKVRGRPFCPGFHPFTITAGGITAYPRIRTPERFEKYVVPTGHLSTGLPRLDELLAGGVPEGSATLVAGGTGVGKTLLGLHFITEGCARGEPGVIVTFQENPSQLRRLAAGFGWDLAALEDAGLLELIYSSPVEIQPDIHAARVKAAVRRAKAHRVLIDSLRDLEIAARNRTRYRDYVYSLVDDFKHEGVTLLLTHEVTELFGAFRMSEEGISIIVDNVILLRYVEMGGRIARAISVLKVRGSPHGKEISRFEITEQGMEVGAPIRAAGGVLTGAPMLSGDCLLQHISPRVRYVVETLRVSAGTMTISLLQEATGLPAALLESILQDLKQQGLVLQSDEPGGPHFRAAI
jgi:circadian clock protein KaiC